MGIIRGKIESDRECYSGKVTIGDPTFFECECGKWFDKETGKECIVMTFDEAFELENCKEAKHE